MDMDGMSMGTNMFQSVNMMLAEVYWYIIAGTVGSLVVIRAINYLQCWLRLRARASSSQQYPTKPTSRFWKLWATLTAIVREASYPQLYVPFRGFTWLTPPPVGKVVVLLVYWSVIIGFMTAGAIIKDASFYERLGFRNAWVTVTQLPFLYLLASKSSVLGALIGSSHERLNWLHRWVARTMFVTASVHGWQFYTEYKRAGMVDIFFEMMPMGKYGIGAWGLLLWSFVSGFAPLRHWCYEFFVIQHIITAILMLWLIYKHVPTYARYNVWFAIACLVFDRVVRVLLLLWQNIRIRPNISGCKGGQRFGHQAQIRAVGDDTTVITIKDVHFRWHAGQHLYLWMPSLGPLEAHPYTIASAHQLPETCVCNSIQLVVRKHSGFSKRLHDRAVKLQEEDKASRDAAARDGVEKKRNMCNKSDTTFTVFVTGPYGTPTRWDIYETLILISASTGASYTLPILESVLQAKQAHICTSRIEFLLAAKKGDEIGYYLDRLHSLIDKAKDVGIELTVQIALTRDAQSIASSSSLLHHPAFANAFHKHSHGNRQSSTSSVSSVGSSSVAMSPGVSPAMAGPEEKAAGVGLLADVETDAVITSGSGSRDRAGSTDSHVQLVNARPDIEDFIRGPVEACGGETSVVVCAGKSLVARTRNCVARLSDERAVHKGTDAQGIHLHVEEYDF